MAYAGVIRRLCCLALGIPLLAVGELSPAKGSPPMPTNHRVILLTDIGGDPDDQQSMVRLLLYANELDIEALIATAMSTGTNRDQIESRVKAYGEVLPNLRRHADGFPDAEQLMSLIKTGSQKRDMTSVGKGKSTEGSEFIIEVVDRDDPRPVWVTVWGAPTDLAQAFWDVRDRRDDAGVKAFTSKLRVYDIAGQDDTGGWICHNFPDLFWIRSVDQFQAISVRKARPFPPEVTGANIETFTTEWVAEHIQSHGSLGALYVDRKWKYEGDTPAYFYLLPNGLSAPESPHYGGWGGRFTKSLTKNPPAFRDKNTAGEARCHDFFMYTDAGDTWSWGKHTYKNSRHASLFRWREAFQNDFAARMDWTITERKEDANHNPIAAFDGDTSGEIVRLIARPGVDFTLSAKGSSDPDGDELTYRWFHYPEPGDDIEEITIENADKEEATWAPREEDKDRELHFILEVRDDGEPNLFAYRRVVVIVSDVFSR